MVVTCDGAGGGVMFCATQMADVVIVKNTMSYIILIFVKCSLYTVVFKSLFN